jgi:hypothetical protein
MPGRFMKLGETGRLDHPSIQVSIPYVTSFPGRRKRAKDLWVPVKCSQIWWAMQITRMNRPRGKTCILLYQTVWPIILPLQFPSRLYNTSPPWLLLSVPLYHQHPSSLVPLSSSLSSLLYPTSPSAFPPFRILSLRVTYPSPLYHFERFPRLPGLPCLLVIISRHRQPLTACTLLSTTSSFEGLNPIYLQQKSIPLTSPSETPFPRSSGSTLSSGDSLLST